MEFKIVRFQKWFPMMNVRFGPFSNAKGQSQKETILSLSENG
jgi:hypothetical protein